MADAYSQLLNARFGADYEVPDWVKSSGFMLNRDRETVNDFFARNPQYAEDWSNITSGGKSKFSTDGSGLVKSNLNNMQSGVADYYRNNVDELLSNEGFNFDPTLAYMNYHQGSGSLGLNPKNTNISEWLQNNKWTPNGVVGNNNVRDYGRTAFGAGTQSLQSNAQQYGSTRAPNKPMEMGYGGGSMSSTFQQNPYAEQMANTLGQQMGEQFQRQIAPQISSGAQLAGGYGGSRQAVMEANAANDLQQNTGQAMGNLLGGMYGQDLSYNLGMGNLDLGYANLDRNINNDNNQWGLQGAQLGMQIQDRQLQQNQLGLANGTQIYNQPWTNINQYGQLYNQIGQGYGQTSQSGGGGNPMMGMLGGAQLGNQFGRQLGSWWDSTQSMTGNGGWGTGNAYGNQDLGSYF
jgi:hypothetical protein